MTLHLKIAILGGTGTLGGGLALRWSAHHEIAIGSRDSEKGKRLAEEYRQEVKKHHDGYERIRGGENAEAIKDSDVIVPALPYVFIPQMAKMLEQVVKSRAVILSPIVPMEKKGDYFIYVDQELPIQENARGSAAEQIAQYLPQTRVVAALNTIPAIMLSKFDRTLDYDVFMAGDDQQAVQLIADLLKEIPGLNPIYAGPLPVARQIEGLVPLLLNLSRHGKMKAPSFKAISTNIKEEVQYGG